MAVNNPSNGSGSSYISSVTSPLAVSGGDLQITNGGFIYVDGADTTPGMASQKIIAGTGMSATIVSSGGNEQLRLDCTVSGGGGGLQALTAVISSGHIVVNAPSNDIIFRNIDPTNGTPPAPVTTGSGTLTLSGSLGANPAAASTRLVVLWAHNAMIGTKLCISNLNNASNDPGTMLFDESGTILPTIESDNANYIYCPTNYFGNNAVYSVVGFIDAAYSGSAWTSIRLVQGVGGLAGGDIVGSASSSWWIDPHHPYSSGTVMQNMNSCEIEISAYSDGSGATNYFDLYVSQQGGSLDSVVASASGAAGDRLNLTAKVPPYGTYKLVSMNAITLNIYGPNS